MTCMKQEFCIHEKYCQRHIGQNFDSCILFSRNSKPMTNEEWIKSMNTEQLAEWLRGVYWHCHEIDCKHCNYPWRCMEKGDIVVWLKQPHESVTNCNE